MRVVGIHGINQHRQQPDELEKAWRDVLTAGIRKVDPRHTECDLVFDLVF
jgi:hypothetical protein